MMRTLWRDLPIGTKGLIVVAIPVLPLLLTALLYFESEAASGQAAADIERAWRNRTLQMQALTLALQAETAVSGYLLSRNTSWLDLQRKAATEGAAVLASLEAGTRDPQQRNQLPRLRDFFAGRLEALNGVIEIYEARGLEDPAIAPLVRRGEEMMNGLRAEVGRMNERNTELLTLRAARAEALAQRSRWIVAAGAAAGVLGGLMGAVLFSSGITRRVVAATQDVTRLAAGEPLAPGAPGGDEIGTLRSGMERASGLLQRHDQEIRRRVRELEDLTRELEAFSYSVSHDLRAPLRHVVGFASMLEKSAGEALTDQQRRHIHTIVEAAGHMSRLIDDLLAFSRTSRSALRVDAVDLGSVIGDVRRQLEREVNGRRIEWRLRPLPTVYGDASLLRVAFDNLLANAIKYTRPREHAAIEIGTQAGNAAEVVVYVRDNGVGFQMEYVNKLFGVFQRLHRAEEFEGTGIGLATVQRIVSRHGGRVWAEGRPGEGATFYVALPTERSST